MRRSISFLIIMFLVFVSFLSSPDFSRAQITQEISYESINPKDGYKYIFKRLGEKIMLTVLSLSPEREADYYQKLIKIRLAELKYVVDKKDLANIQTVNQRYFATAGQAVEYVKKNNLLQHKEKLRNLFAEHLLVLAILKQSFNDTTAEWRFLEHNVDYLKLYSAQLT